MNHLASHDNHLLVLERGEELFEQLNKFAQSNQLKSAWLSGIGGAEGLTLGFYDLSSRQYIWQDFPQALEITSLSGNLSIVDDQPFWHIHGVFSGPDYQSISGHVKSLKIGLTGEILITPLASPLGRFYDDSTGLKLIDRA